MNVPSCTNGHNIPVAKTTGPVRSTVGQFKDICTHLVTKQPVVTTATSLTLIGFLASFSAKSRVVFASGVGITSVAMLVYHIFSSTNLLGQKSSQPSLNKESTVQAQAA